MACCHENRFSSHQCAHPCVQWSLRGKQGQGKDCYSFCVLLSEGRIQVQATYCASCPVAEKAPGTYTCACGCFCRGRPTISSYRGCWIGGCWRNHREPLQETLRNRGVCRPVRIETRRSGVAECAAAQEKCFNTPSHRAWRLTALSICEQYSFV